MKNENLSWNEPAAERFEMLDDAMFSLSNALESIRGIGEFAELYDTLSGVYEDMEAIHDDLDREAAGEYQAYVEDMTRDYYRSVM